MNTITLFSIFALSMIICALVVVICNLKHNERGLTKVCSALLAIITAMRELEDGEGDTEKEKKEE